MLSLPKAQRQAEEEPMPEHIQKRLNEDDPPHYHHHSDDHQDDHHYHAHAGYADAYGLGDGWSI